MDHAHLLQRTGRNLRREHGRSRPTPPSPSPTRPTHRPPLPPPRQHYHPHLHRRLPLLRRKSLARLPQHPPPHLIFSSEISTPRLPGSQIFRAKTCALCNSCQHFRSDFHGIVKGPHVLSSLRMSQNNV